MAASVVYLLNSRLDDMDTDTNVTDIGGGGGSGPLADFVYQGTQSVARKVGTSPLGFYTDTGGVTDISNTGVYQNVMFKVDIVNPKSLDPAGAGASGVVLHIGSDDGNYNQYNPYDNLTYPTTSSWVIVPINPNVAGYATTIVGSPLLNAADYFGIICEFTATSKSDNIALDAIDVGNGMVMIGGDGGDTDGTFQGFIDRDWGTDTSGRAGYVALNEGIMLCYGEMIVGNETGVGFTDDGKVLVYPDYRCEEGWSKLQLGLENASTSVNISNCTFISNGTTNITDTRGVLLCLEDSGVAVIDGCSFTNYQQISLSSGVTFSNNVIVNAEGIVQSGAIVTNNTFSDSPASTSGSMFLVDYPNRLTSNAFSSAGVGHAIELSESGTFNFIGNIFSDYAAQTGEAGDRMIYNNSGGAITLNVQGGTTVSYRNGSGASTTVNNTISITVNVENSAGTSIDGARVLIEADTGGDLPAQASVNLTRSGATVTVAHTSHGLSTGAYVIIRGAIEYGYNGDHQITVTGPDEYTYTITETPDSPATGTVTSSARIMNELTAGGGVASESFSYTNPQPITGVVRKSSGTPNYKTGTISGDIDGDNLSISIILILDE
jgi:hypothetical protein